MNKSPSTEEIEKALKEIDFPSTEHFEWEENGQKYSSWKIKIPSSDGKKGIIIHTGDGGMEMFQKYLKKYINGEENRTGKRDS